MNRFLSTYFKGNDVVEQTENYMDTIAFIDSIMDANPNSSFIVIGDMNCDFYNGTNDFTNILRNFVRERNLYCSFDSMPAFDASK